jgi:hypothetical protein
MANKSPFDQSKPVQLCICSNCPFDSLPGLDQIRLFDALVASGVRSWEWWFNVLLADQEPLPEGIFD